MPEFLTDPISRLIKLFNITGSEPGGRRIIALAGYPGSGKSTIAQLWVEEVNKKIGNEELLVLGMDGFHLTKAQLRAMDDPDTALARRGAPYTFNPEGLIEKLTELRNAAGKNPVGWPGFEHGVGDPVNDAVFIPPDCRLILVEGIYTLYRDGFWAGLNGLFDETWFLDTDVETAMGRLYKRHQEAWGMSEEEARRRADGNDRLNCEHIMPGRQTADYLVGG
jgi:pantothenate kinase